MASVTPTAVRLLQSAAIILIAFGGAGLAVAADRPHNPMQRPELTRRADAEAQPWIERMTGELVVLDRALTDVSLAGRSVLTRLLALDLAAVNDALMLGDPLVVEIDAAAFRLSGVLAESTAIERWRLSPQVAGRLATIDVAAIEAAAVDDAWGELTDGARRAMLLVDALRRHDQLALEATNAAATADWDAAMALVEQAGAALEEAAALRDELAATGSVATLDGLLGRYREYDEAHGALYQYVRDTGLESGAEFEARRVRVDEARAAQPVEGEWPAVIGESASPAIAESLIIIEEAHGRVNAALDTAIE